MHFLICCSESQHHICFPAESTEPDSDHSEAFQGELNWGTVYKITGLNDSRCQGQKWKRAEQLFRTLRKAKRAWQLNSMQKPDLDSGQRMKIYYWESWQNLKVDVDSIACHRDVKLLILKTELWYVRAFFFLEYTLSYLVVKKKTTRRIRIKRDKGWF